MSLDLDFLTQVVNVHWEGGLAVEFTDRPDYLTLNSALSMNKVTVSFWFRVPTEAAEAARSKNGLLWDYRVFLQVIPLITWGSQQTTPVTDVEVYDTGSIDAETGGIITLERTSGSHAAPLQPSCIGVRVLSEPPTLDIHIQTNVHASGTGLAKMQSGFTGDFVGTSTSPGPTFGKPLYANVEYTTEDISYSVTEEPEYLGNSDSNSSNSGAGHPEVTLDKWHHLLISWELLPHSNLSGASKMWCAIDDKNKDGFDLPAMCAPALGMGPNDHMTWTTFNWKGDADVFASVSFGSNVVPSNPVQVPAPPTVKRGSDYAGSTISIAPIEKVELAELQIFTGIALDTSKQSNRRAFIDFERDADGNPIKDQDGKSTLKPVNPEKAKELLGQRPDILLHGTSDWQEGKNTGSIGIDTDGKEIPGGQFKPTGTIEKYTPDPTIEQ